MKHTIYRALALLIALLLVTPTFAFAEDVQVIESGEYEPEAMEAEAFAFGGPDIEGTETDEILSPDEPEPVAPVVPDDSDIEASASDEAVSEEASEPAEDEDAEPAEDTSADAEAAADDAEIAADAPQEDGGEDEWVPEQEDVFFEDAPELGSAAFDAMDGAVDEAELVCAPESEIAYAYGGTDNDALMESYVQQLIDASLDKPARRFFAEARENLTGNDALIYQILAERIPDIANGTESSSVFTITVDEFIEKSNGSIQASYTAEELGVSALIADGKFTSEALEAIRAKVRFSLQNVLGALLADHPLELYWYDKTVGATGESFGISGNSSQMRYTGQITIYMTPSVDYGDPATYTVDNSRIDTVNTAIANAKAIVANHSTGDVLQRMIAYKNAICEMTSYNRDAANNGAPYGDPWQLIHAFDGDENTKVVCEGYSKAFKYLFDLSKFGSDFDCILVSGVMSGGTGEGKHMWNLVRMDDGRSYLVDVTNCDSGTIGAPDKLFMAYNPSGSWNDVYTFTLTGDRTISYKYDDKTKNLFKQAQLSVSTAAYEAWIITIDGADGIVSTDHAQVPKGTSATITVSVQDGYVLKSLAVKDSSGADVAVNGNQFIMPESDVTIYAEYEVTPAVQPAISAEPQDLNLTYGVGGELSVNVAEAEGHVLSMQWYKGDSASDFDGTALSEETGNTLTIPADAPAGTAYYYCVVTAQREDNGRTATSTTRAAKVAIAQREITITAKDQTVMRLGAIDTSVDQVTISGALADGNSLAAVTLTDSGTEHATDNGSITPDNAVIKAGDVDVTANYDITYTSGKLCVLKSIPQVTAPEANAGLTYSGAEQALVKAGATTGGTLQYALGTGQTAPTEGWQAEVPVGVGAGSYSVWYRVQGDEDYGGTTITGPLTVTIDGVPLTVTANDVSISYGDAPADGGVSYQGFVNGEDASALGGALQYDFTYAQYGDVGDYAITPKGLTSDNYAISFVPGALTVAPLAVGLQWADTSLTYNGGEQAPTAEATGLVNDDAVTVTVTGGATDAGNYTAAAALAGAKAGNYALPAVTTQAFTIARRRITITANDQAVTRHGTIDSALNQVAVTGSGLAEGHTLTAVTLTGSDTENATDNGTITPSDAVIKAGDVDVTANYDISYVSGTLTVGKEMPGITVPAAQTELIYTGAEQALIQAGATTGGTLQYALGTDQAASPDGWQANAPVGVGAGCYYVWYRVVGDENYASVAAKAPVVVEIGQAPLTVTANDVSISYGDAPADGGVSYQSFVNGEDASALGGALQYDFTYAQYGDVGDYAITPKGMTADNYAISFVPGALTVAPLAVGLQWADTSLTYNGGEQAPTAEATGLVNNDAVTVTVTGGATDAGSYSATAALAGAKAGNYALNETAKTASFTIARAAARTLTDIAVQVVYPDSAFTAVLSGAMPADANVTGYNAGSVQGIDSVAVDQTSGTLSAAFTVSAIGGSATLPVTLSSVNYEDSIVNVVVTRVARPIEGAAVALSQTGFEYDGTARTVAIESVKLGDATLVEGVDYALDGSAQLSGTEVGEYRVGITGMGNYTGSAVAVWTIAAPAPQPVAPAPQPVAPAPAPAADTTPEVPPIPAVKAAGKVTVSVVPGTTVPLNLGGVPAGNFKSSNKKVATVDSNGNVTFKKAGKVKITMKVGKKKRTVTLTVKDATMPTSVSLSAPTTAVKKGEVLTLTPVIPANTHSTFTWKTSNKKVATVKNGVVTFKKAGRVTITVTAKRGKKKARRTFTVSN